MKELFNIHGLGKEKAQIYGRELERIYKKYKKKGFTAKTVLTEASSLNSPIHDYFEWDDSIAGPLYREEQARKLIRLVKVTIVSNEEEKSIRKFFNVFSNGCDEVNKEESKYNPYSGGRVFVSVDEVFNTNNKGYKEQILKAALWEIENWQEKYKFYSELDKVVNKEEIIKIKNEL